MTIESTKDLLEALRDGGKVERRGGMIFSGTFKAVRVMTHQEEMDLMHWFSRYDGEDADSRQIVIEREEEGDEWFMVVGGDDDIYPLILHQVDGDEKCIDGVRSYHEV